MPEILTPAVEQTDSNISLYPVVQAIQEQHLKALTLATPAGIQTYPSHPNFINAKIQSLTYFLRENRAVAPGSKEYNQSVEAQSYLSEIALQEVAEEIFGDEFVVKRTPSSLDTSVPLVDTHRGIITEEPVKKRSEGGDVIILRKKVVNGVEILEPYLLLDAKLSGYNAPKCPFNTTLNIASFPISVAEFQWMNMQTQENLGFRGYALYMKKLILHEHYYPLWKKYEDTRNQWVGNTAHQINEGLDLCRNLLALQQEAYGVEEGDDEILHRLSVLKKATARHLHLN